VRGPRPHLVRLCGLNARRVQFLTDDDSKRVGTRRRNVERVSLGDEPRGVLRGIQALESVEPQERQRHETRPQGVVRINPPRVWERPKGDGVSGGTETICRFAAFERWRGGEPHGRSSLAEQRSSLPSREGGRPRVSLKEAEVCERNPAWLTVVRAGTARVGRPRGQAFSRG
jgi:hypothetical protein